MTYSGSSADSCVVYIPKASDCNMEDLDSTWFLPDECRNSHHDQLRRGNQMHTTDSRMAQSVLQLAPGSTFLKRTNYSMMLQVYVYVQNGHSPLDATYNLP